MKALIITTFALLLATNLPAQTSTQQIASAKNNQGKNGPDGMIVTEVASAENELPTGTAIWFKLQTPLYSNISHPGQVFSAKVSRDVVAHGKVMIPAGVTLMGKVVYAHDGNRWLLGRAKIRLRPEDLVMPDGTHMPIYATIVDTDPNTNTKANDDGTIAAGPSSATEYLTLQSSRINLPAGMELVMELSRPLEFAMAATPAK